MDQLPQLLVSGASVGVLYSLIAMGFVLIYKASGVVNIAQGQILLLAGYFGYTFRSLLHFPVWVSLLATLVAVVLVAAVIERLALRPLMGQPVLATVLMTLGLAILLDGVTVLAWGTGYVPSAVVFPDGGVWFAGTVVSYQQLLSLAGAVVLLILFALFFRYSRVALRMRAVSDNSNVAQSLGMKLPAVYRSSWMIACAVSALAGVLLTSTTGVHYSLTALGLRAIAVVILGGLESIPGVVIAGPLLGMFEFLVAGYLDQFVGGGTRDVSGFVLMTVILFFRPYGLFGWQKIERV